MQTPSVGYKTLKAWLPLAAVTIIFSGLLYVAVQQNYRQSANDPQIQISEDIVDAIGSGTPPDSIVSPTGSTEMSKTLSPWVMIFDDTGKMIGSSAVLDGKNPNFPTSILDNVKKSGKEARLTWQPRAGVRMAVVVARYSGSNSGYVVAGRSLREVEVRENQLTIMTAAATALALVVSLLLAFLMIKLSMPKAAEAEAPHDHEHGHNHDHPHHHET